MDVSDHLLFFFPSGPLFSLRWQATFTGPFSTFGRRVVSRCRTAWRRVVPVFVKKDISVIILF